MHIFKYAKYVFGGLFVGHVSISAHAYCHGNRYDALYFLLYSIASLLCLMLAWNQKGEEDGNGPNHPS